MEVHPHIEQKVKEAALEQKGIMLLFETKDLALAAYLRMMGLEIKKIFKPRDKVVFSFIDTPKRKELIDDYFAGKARVDPLVYKDTLRNLKTYTYNRK